VARTTFRLDPELLAEAKALAARQHRTLNSVMEDALRRLLAQSATRVGSRPFELHVHDGPARGLQADISIDEGGVLLERMEAGVPADERR